MFTSCTKDFLDINDNPNRPTTAELSKLLSGAQYEVGMSYSCGYYIGTSLPSTIFHLTSREVNNYGIAASTSTLGNTWLQAYVYGLKNTNAVIEAAEETDNLIYAGIAKLMKAYSFLNLVDLWGDVPYSEFDISGNYTPTLDSDKDIYNNLFALIDEGISDLINEESQNLLRPGSDDLIYGGNTRKWIKMANSLKLKMLVNSRKGKGDINSWNEKLSSVLSENNFIEDGEDFQFLHTAQDNPDERHPAYTDEYLAGQSTYYINPWLYETMTGKNLNVTDNPFTGIVDPRVPYFWVNQIKANGTAQNDTDYRDGGFVSIFFASNSAYAGFDQRTTSTFIGIYPCGGKFDDGSAGRCGAANGSGVAPEKMLQAYSIPFLLAELYLTGEATGDAREMLASGIRSSITHVNTVAAAANAAATNPQTVPGIHSDEIENFITEVLRKYDAASSNEEKLRIVMTQKWIANFFNSIEAYTDMRRTGYPTVLSNTNTALSPYEHSAEPAVGPAEIPLSNLNAFPRAMWYPTSEITRNPNVSNTNRVLSQNILFWDK